MKLILASASPRRERLLKKLVKRFSVKAAHIDETIHAGEPFSRACVRLAEKKARKVFDKQSVVIGADTIAYFRKKNFRKTSDARKAESILLFLRGKTHYVITGVCVTFPSGKQVKYSVKAAVKMKNFSNSELVSYLKSGEWKGRAGCYDISGKGAKLVQSVKGEKETVVGLPIKKLKNILSSA
ncbi:MAG: Maf family protein [Candidatus Micrarchaeota archaeon]|nr:Maf family protein [Candidatus Micrarchaeota archaeon]